MKKIEISLLWQNESIIPLCFAKDNNYLEDLKYEIKINFHKNIWSETDNILSGNILMNRGDITRYISLKEKKDLKIVSNFTRDFQLFKRNENVDLANATILISEGTSIEFYTNMFEEKEGIKFNKKGIKEIKKRYEEYLSNEEIDCIMVPNPYADLLIEKGFIKVWDIRETDVNIKTWMVDAKFAEENEEFLKEFFTKINEATIEFNQLNKKEKEKYMKKYEMTSFDYENLKFELQTNFTKKSFEEAMNWLENEELKYDECVKGVL